MFQQLLFHQNKEVTMWINGDARRRRAVYTWWGKKAFRSPRSTTSDILEVKLVRMKRAEEACFSTSSKRKKKKKNVWELKLEKREMIISTVSCLADYPPRSRPPLFICPASNMHSTSPGQRNVAYLLPVTDPVQVDSPPGPRPLRAPRRIRSPLRVFKYPHASNQRNDGLRE